VGDMELGKRFVLFVLSFVFSFQFDGLGNYHNVSDFLFQQKTFISPHYVDQAILKYDNPEVVGRLSIASIGLDVPVVQHDDNDFYLNHDEYRNENKMGAVFLDFRNRIHSDRKLLIFGHNSKTMQTEFKKLEKFLSSDFYYNIDHRKLILETKKKTSIYHVSSVFIVFDDFQHMNLSFTQEEWKKHLAWIHDSSIYQDEFLTVEDDIIILQTCYYEPEHSYLLVVAKKVKEEYF